MIVSRTVTPDVDAVPMTISYNYPFDAIDILKHSTKTVENSPTFPRSLEQLDIWTEMCLECFKTIQLYKSTCILSATIAHEVCLQLLLFLLLFTNRNWRRKRNGLSASSRPGKG